MPRFPWVICFLVLPACAGTRNDKRSATEQVPADQSIAATLTPGYCGAWETMDSTSRADCRKVLLSSKAAGLPAQGDCTFFEIYPLDSLHACLNRSDSLARSCPVVHSWVLRQADGAARVAEWHRCGPQGGAWVGDSAVYPVSSLLIRRDSLPASPAIFVFSNNEEPEVGGLDTALAIDFDGDGTDELFFINHTYGTGNILEPCALVVAGGKWRCWEGPEFPELEEVLQPGQALFKGWGEAWGSPTTPPDTTRPRYATRQSIWYFSPVYHEGDANCCPTTNLSLWVEARPHNGRFETGLVLRAHEDSNQTILSIDTLRH